MTIVGTSCASISYDCKKAVFTSKLEIFQPHAAQHLNIARNEVAQIPPAYVSPFPKWIPVSKLPQQTARALRRALRALMVCTNFEGMIWNLRPALRHSSRMLASMGLTALWIDTNDSYSSRHDGIQNATSRSTSARSTVRV